MDYGETSFLFTGDAEGISEDEMVDNDHNLKADVLKVGHHGSNTSTTVRFLDAVNPKYAIIQLAKDNKYGHPSTEIIDRLEERSIKIYRNDLDGTIIGISDGENIKFSFKKDSYKDTEKVKDKLETEYGKYIGNKNSRIFHINSCNSLPIEENRIYFEDREEAINEGYRGCKRCKP